MGHVVLLLTAALAAQDAMPTDSPPPVPQIQSRFTVTSVPKEQAAAVTYDFADGTITFRATVAGREVWALIDTGSSSSLMDLELARSAGIRFGTEEKQLQTARGEFTKHLVYDVPVLIPGIFELKYPLFAAIDMAGMSKY